MVKIVVYPNPSIGTANPYIPDLCDSIGAINKSEIQDSNAKNLVKHLFDGNVYIFNWPENAIFRKYGKTQFFVLLICVTIIWLRNCKIIWIFHNMEPHQGHNAYSRFIYRLFYKISDLIVPHSKEASIFLAGKTKAMIDYEPHPFRFHFNDSLKKSIKKEYDIIIWGAISKYKGIVEFLEYRKIENRTDNRILIIGKCNDEEYDKRIRINIDDNVKYINKFLDKDSLNEYIKLSRYVLFPYLKNTVSSSGALMDSLLLGANVIGPNAGAFGELAEEEICFSFDDYQDIFAIIHDKRSIDLMKIKEFVNKNTWSEYSNRLQKKINQI